MKRRTQKLFIAMFAFLIAWFAITSAYVFDVTNWNPFWTLNLSKLIIKNLSQTWIILDSEDYTIKIDPDHNDPDGWQIRVYQICDENGQNCRAIANLYTWTQGVPWPQWNTWADGVWIQDISSEKVWKTTTVTVTYTNWETLSFDILDWNDGTSVNWWWMAFTNNSQNNYICWKSWDAVTCNGLKLSTYPQNNRLCYVKDNVLYCDQVNLFEELSGRINDVSENINNWALTIYKGWTSYIFTANQSGDTTVQLWAAWKDDSICLKSWDDIRCYWTMNNGRLCKYDSSSKTVNCTENLPWNRKINFKNSSGAILYTFSLNDSWNDLDITWPSWAGWGWQPWPQGATWENWISVVDAFIEWNNIVFKLSNDTSIVLKDAMILLKWDKWEAWTCEGQCTGSWDGITVSWVNVGWYCRYITQNFIDLINSDKPLFDIAWQSTEGWRIQCTFTGWSSSSTQSITINWVQNNICVKVNDTTINCNIPLEDIQWSWWWDGSDLWLGNNALIYPQKTTTKVAIGTTRADNYMLNVNWSWWIQNNLKLGTYLYFEWRPITRNVFNFKQSAVAQKSSPVIEYYNDLLIRPLNIVTDYRTNNYITLWKSWNVWIGWEYSTWNYKLSVYGRQRIYAENSGLSKYIDIYNDWYTSYVTSKWSFMKIGLIGDQDYLWVPLPSSYIYFWRDSVWVNIEPTQNTYNPSNWPTSNWYYVPRFQVNGSIQIKSEYEVTNKTQELNRFKCRSEIEWTIAYWSWQFYWCAKTINWTQINYKRRVFDTTSLAAWDAIPAPIDQTLSN